MNKTFKSTSYSALCQASKRVYSRLEAPIQENLGGIPFSHINKKYLNQLPF